MSKTKKHQIQCVKNVLIDFHSIFQFNICYKVNILIPSMDQRIYIKVMQNILIIFQKHSRMYDCQFFPAQKQTKYFISQIINPYSYIYYFLTINMKPWFSFIFFSLFQIILGDIYLSITPTSTQTNVLTDYLFTLNPTPIIATIPMNSIITITFPIEYTTNIINPVCSPNLWWNNSAVLSCKYSSRVLTVTGGFPAAASQVYTLSFTVSNVTNPFPAITTSSFIVSLTYANQTVIDYSQQSYYVTLTTGAATCSNIITNNIVFTIGNVFVNFTPKNPIANTYLLVSMNRYYPTDLNQTNINASILSSNVSGSYNFYLLYNSSGFNITMLMPPSTQPAVGFITITSYMYSGTTQQNIDQCSITISGITPNNLTNLSIVGGGIQTLSNMIFTFSFQTPFYTTDLISVSFSNYFTLTNIGNNITFYSGVIGTRNITINSNTITIYNTSTALNLSKTSVGFNVSNIYMPYSSYPATITVSTLTSSNYYKDSSTFIYYAASNTFINVSNTCNDFGIGMNTLCTFTMVLKDNLNNQGYIIISLPNGFSITAGNYLCQTNGTLSINSNCTNYPNNTILIKNITSTTIASNTQVSILINLTLPAIPSNYQINISSYSPGLVDSSLLTLTTVSRNLKSTQFSISTSSLYTFTNTIYTINLNLPIPILTNATFMITIPMVSNGVVYCNNGSVNSVFIYPNLNLTLQNPFPTVFNISGLNTPVSTQPILISAIITSALSPNIVYYYINNITLIVTNPKNFTYFSLIQSSNMVYSSDNVTFFVSGLGNDTIIINGGIWTNYCGNISSNLINISCIGLTNGVQITLFTAGILNDSTQSSFTVSFINPSIIGTQTYNITTYSGNYSKQSTTFILVSTIPNILTASLSQTNPYFKENSTYTLLINGTTPTSQSLNIIFPPTYTIINSTCLINCVFQSLNTTTNVLTYTLTSYINIGIQIFLTNPFNYIAINFNSYLNQGNFIDSGSIVPVTPCNNSHCRSCQNDSITCLTCYNWSIYYLLYNGDCLSNCLSNQFINLTTNICVFCNSSCLTCYNLSTCTSCNLTSQFPILYNLNCIKTCPDGTYQSNFACLTCPISCTTCSSTILCLSCSLNYNLYNQSCLFTCPNGTYSQNSICNSCTSGCLLCSQLGCTNCISTLYLYNKTCINSCPTNLFSDGNGNCKFCSSPCANCLGTIYNCTSCIVQYYLLNNSCLSACPNGYFINLNTQNCEICVFPCSSCYNTNTTCLSCQNNYYLYFNICYSICPIATYINSINTCAVCVQPCATCTSNVTCLTCVTGYLLNNTLCINNCTFGNLYYNQSNVCTACVSPCATCTSKTICLSCLVNYYVNGSCESNCLQGFYPNSTTTCTSCVQPCSTCTTNISCLSCVLGYLQYNITSCLLSCPSGYYNNSGKCLACVLPCATCSSNTTCLSCALNYYVNGSCLSSCLDGYYPNSTNTCTICIAPCDYCTSTTICLSCKAGYILNNTSCITNCTINNLFYNNSGICTVCPTPCKACILNLTITCLSCLVNYYVNGSCLDNCLDGYYPNGTNTCTICIQPCYTCTSSIICLSCISGYVLNNSTCILSCSLGFFNNNSVCSACISPCATCSSSTTCLSCLVNYYVNGKCLSSCQAGYFPSVNICLACVQPCATCTSNLSCNTCIQNYLLFNQTNCINSCPITYYNNSGICSACVSPCATCISNTSCLTCSINYYVNGSCLSSCIDGYYPNSTNTCTMCILPCEKCITNISCISCVTGYLLNNNSCITNCLDGYYANSGLCTPCVTPCINCLSNQICLSCSINYYLNGSCLQNCSQGYFGDNIRKICAVCVQPCATCTSNVTCLTCVTGYLLNNTLCINNCTFGNLYYNQSNVCTACVSPCATCTSKTICLSCLVNYYVNGSCESNCLQGFYPNSTTTCTSCVQPCSTCTTNISCLSCVLGYLQYNITSCLLSCPSGYYNNSGKCLACVLPCATCSSNTTCLSCALNYYVNGSCLSSCLNGYYPNSTNTCTICIAPCGNCTSSTSCLDCQFGYLLNKTSCINNCTTNNLYYNQSNVCTACVSPCATCTSKTICLSCLVNYYVNGSCESNCLQGFYPNSTTTCTSCVQPCSTCTTNISCLSCVLGYLQYNITSCLLSCPSGYYNNSGKCLACVLPCATCSSNTTCLSCALNYYVNGSCLSSCLDGYYPNSTNTCTICIAPCDYCTSTTICLSCKAGYILNNTSCIPSCPSGYYNNSNVCFPCISPCSTCLTKDICLTCSINYFSNGSCLQYCPNGSYPNSTTTCTNCIQPCSTCTNSTVCLSCISSYYLYNNICSHYCPSKYYPSTNICISCVSPCDTCISATNCLTCVSGYIANYTCSATCPNTYFPLNSTYCQPCSPPCDTCTNTTACLTCLSNFLFYNSSCLTICPDKFYNSSGICMICNIFCLTCQTYNSCLSCPIGSYLLNSSCISSCPNNYYQAQANGSNICLSCISPCLTCTNNVTCLSCIQGYNLFDINKTCLSQCPYFNSLYYYNNNSICYACQSPCVKCLSINKCLTCDQTSNQIYYIQSNQTCVSSCPITLHLNSITNVCQNCQYPCDTCKESTICLSCLNNLFLNNSECLTTCPVNYYNISYSCYFCPNNCQNCLYSNNSVPNITMYCTTCKEGTFIYGYGCINTCPANTTILFTYCTSQICQVQNCTICSGIRCLNCSSFYRLNTTNNSCYAYTTPIITSNSLIPFVFFGSTILLIIIFGAVKIQYPDMYLPMVLFSTVGILETAAIAFWAYNYYPYLVLFSLNFYFAIALVGTYILLNIINFFMIVHMQKDKIYRIWCQDHFFFNFVIVAISLLITFRFSRIQFSKFGDMDSFQAKLSATQTYRPLNAVSVISLLMSIGFSLFCGYLAYLQTSVNQLFYCSIEVLLISVLLFFITIAELIRPKDFLIQNPDQYAHGKDNEDMKLQSINQIIQSGTDHIGSDSSSISLKQVEPEPQRQPENNYQIISVSQSLDQKLDQNIFYYVQPSKIRTQQQAPLSFPQKINKTNFQEVYDEYSQRSESMLGEKALQIVYTTQHPPVLKMEKQIIHEEKIPSQLEFIQSESEESQKQEHYEVKEKQMLKQIQAEDQIYIPPQNAQYQQYKKQKSQQIEREIQKQEKTQQELSSGSVKENLIIFNQEQYKQSLEYLKQEKQLYQARVAQELHLLQQQMADKIQQQRKKEYDMELQQKQEYERQLRQREQYQKQLQKERLQETLLIQQKLETQQRIQNYVNEIKQKQEQEKQLQEKLTALLKQQKEYYKIREYKQTQLMEIEDNLSKQFDCHLKMQQHQRQLDLMQERQKLEDNIKIQMMQESIHKNLQEDVVESKKFRVKQKNKKPKQKVEIRSQLKDIQEFNNKALLYREASIEEIQNKSYKTEYRKNKKIQKSQEKELPKKGLIIEFQDNSQIDIDKLGNNNLDSIQQAQANIQRLKQQEFELKKKYKNTTELENIIKNTQNKMDKYFSDMRKQNYQAPKIKHDQSMPLYSDNLNLDEKRMRSTQSFRENLESINVLPIQQQEVYQRNYDNRYLVESDSSYTIEDQGRQSYQFNFQRRDRQMDLRNFRIRNQKNQKSINASKKNTEQIYMQRLSSNREKKQERIAGTKFDLSVKSNEKHKNTSMDMYEVKTIKHKNRYV